MRWAALYRRPPILRGVSASQVRADHAANQARINHATARVSRVYPLPRITQGSSRSLTQRTRCRMAHPLGSGNGKPSVGLDELIKRPALPCRPTDCPLPSGLIASGDLRFFSTPLKPSSFAACMARLKSCPDTKLERTTGTSEGLRERGRANFWVSREVLFLAHEFPSPWFA
jgi:hypothetical protein